MTAPKSSASPTALTLRLLREEGWLCQVVEKWNPHAKIRQDLFGFIDILCLMDDRTLAVQATSYSNMSARVHKITDHENLAAVRKAGWEIWVIGWRKVDNRWKHRIIEIS
jgi:hypothetical protein